MGIKNLNKVIKKHAPSAIKNIEDLTELDLWYIGIDASISIYQWSYATKHIITNKNNEPINHIQGAFFRTSKMILSGIRPMYVFDGIPPEMKLPTIKNRKIKRLSSVSKLSEMSNDVAQLLNILHVPAIRAPSEAEAQLAYYNKINLIDAVATSDYDALAFGAPKIILNLNVSAKDVKIIHLDKVLKEMKLKYEEFVDLCILLGCDYTGTIPGIGQVRAYNLIQKHRNIENILVELKTQKKYKDILRKIDFDYKAVRKLFLQPNIVKNKIPTVMKNSFEKKKLPKINKNKLLQYLLDRGLEKKRIINTIEKLSLSFI